MELDGIAFTGRGLAVLVGEGQDAILIGVSSEVLDVVGGEEETIGSIGIEGHFSAFIIALHHDGLSDRRLHSSCCNRFFCRGFFCRSNECGGGDGIVTGQLIAVGVGIVEFDGISFADRGLSVLVGEGQDTILIGIGAEILDVIRGEEETIGSIGIEGHFSAFIIALHHDGLSDRRLHSSCCNRFFCRGFFCRSNECGGGDGIVTGQLIAVGVGIVEFDGISFADRGLSVLVGEGQDTVLIGVGAEILNVIGGEEETIGSVRIEGHFSAFIIALHHDGFSDRRLHSGSCCGSLCSGD